MCIVSPVAGGHKKKKKQPLKPTKLSAFSKLKEHCLKYLMIRKSRKILHLNSLKCAEY